MTNSELAKALFASFERGDQEAAHALCASHFQARRNQGALMDLQTLLQFSAMVTAIIADFRYENSVCQETPTGFVEEHDVRGTLPDGSQLHLAACVIGEVQDGKIIQLREYLDTTAAAGLIRALQNK